MLRFLVEAERAEVWELEGARDLAHWLSIRYGLSSWKAHRWIVAAHVLEELPELAEALATGELGIDKVLELCRFATPAIERRLLRWAKTVSAAAVRRRADREVRRVIHAEVDAHEARFLEWWTTDEGRRIGLQAELPAAEGAVVIRAIERTCERVPSMPGEEHAVFLPARRADALVTVCSGALGADPDPDRATVVVHARVQASASNVAPDDASDAPLEVDDRGARPTTFALAGAELDSGEVLHPKTALRLFCDARIQEVIEDEHGNVIGLGRLRREPPSWMVRQVRYRDRECRFPGCGARAFTRLHHITWWRHGGRTDLENLVLICSFHHKLVHELGWTLVRDPANSVRWYRPDGTRYRVGPPGARAPTAPPDGTEPLLVTSG